MAKEAWRLTLTNINEVYVVSSPLACTCPSCRSSSRAVSLLRDLVRRRFLRLLCIVKNRPVKMLRLVIITAFTSTWVINSGGWRTVKYKWASETRICLVQIICLKLKIETKNNQIFEYKAIFHSLSAFRYIENYLLKTLANINLWNNPRK